MVNFRIYDALNWETNNYNTHVVNISSSKDNEIREIFFIKTHADSKPRRLVSDVFVFFNKRALYEVKASGQHLSFNIFW